MSDHEITASRLKSDCSSIVRQVDESKVSFTITKDGRPIARLVPVDADDYGAALMGSVTLVAVNDEDYYSTGEPWDLDRPSA